jgi:hypothetical protein
VFNNTVVGLSAPLDDRYKGRLQRDRHPRYRFWRSQSVADVADRCYAAAPALAPGPPGRQWGCSAIPFALGTRYANFYSTAPPEATGEAWIEPLAADVAAPVLADRLNTVNTIPYQRARGRARTLLLDEYPILGLRGEPPGVSSPVHWSVVPLRTEDLVRLSPLETKKLIGQRYVPLLGAVTGGHVAYYLLWLPSS